MAGDRHHSGFDQDEFERYDTFDAPVSDQTDPGREGLFGDLGRLIDQIKINNAANKLDENVSMGEDHVLNVSGNWAAVPHRQLYESVHVNNDPAAAYALAKEWTDLGNVMADNSRAMDEAIRGTESGWQGVAAAAARESTLKLATWGGDAAQTSQYMGTRIAEQGLTAERAKAAMPEPKEFDWEQMLRQGFATGGLAGLTQAVQDVNAASEEARAAHEQAVQVMSTMENQSRSVDQTTPRFVIPPDATSGDRNVDGLMMMRSGTEAVPASAATPMSALAPLQGANGGSDVQGGSQAFTSGSGFSGGAAASGFPGGGGAGAPQPNFGGQPSFGGDPGFGGAGNQPAAASAGPNSFGGSSVPPNFQVPNGPQTGTSTAGFVPPGGTGYPGDANYRPPGYQPPPNFQQPGPGYPGYVPGGPYNPGGSNNRGGQNNSPGGPYNPGGPFNPADPRSGGGYMPPRIDPLTGEPYKPGQGPRPMPFGGPGGAGGGGGGFGGAGSSGGFGGPRGGGGGFMEQGGMRQPGFSAGAGAMAAEEAAAMRGNPAAGRAGAAGAPGMGMGGGMGGGAQRGEEDKEHRSKYATGEKIVEEPGRMVPIVIGDKQSRKQAGEK